MQRNKLNIKLYADSNIGYYKIYNNRKKKLILISVICFAIFSIELIHVFSEFPVYAMDGVLKVFDFPINFVERKVWYKEKNGENWGWLTFRDRRGERLILTPGSWKMDHLCGAGLHRTSVFLSDMDGPLLSSSFDSRLYQGVVIAPNGRDLYAYGMACIYYYDLDAGQSQVIGTPYRPGHRDGPAEQALLGMVPTMNRRQIAMDYSSGRVYFRAGVYPKDYRIRYVEKQSDGTHQVGTIQGFNKLLGQFLLVSSDGNFVYIIHHDYNKTILSKLSVNSGKVLSRINVSDENGKNVIKLNWHTNVDMGMDGFIYLGSGGEAGGNGMSLYRINPENGYSETIFNTYRGQNGQMDTRKDKKWYASILKGDVMADGPAGSPYLFCRSTADITCCPRTGAIYFSGWDGYGIRRFFDGYLTTLISPYGDADHPKAFEGLRPGLGKQGYGLCNFVYGSLSIGVDPKGDIYMNAQGSIMKIYRTDWPCNK